MFTAALFITAKRWKNPRVHQRMMTNKTWSIHNVEYYSALKRKEILTRDNVDKP